MKMAAIARLFFLQKYIWGVYLYGTYLNSKYLSILLKAERVDRYMGLEIFGI